MPDPSKTIPSLKYRWRKTWPDQDNDFSGREGDTIIGRFYLYQSGIGLKWYWHMQACGPGRERVQLSGLCETPREAAHQIEVNYDRLIEIEKAPPAG